MNKCLYLVSSSAWREYVVDCLEALALPRGMVLHFRYRLRYVDKRLADSLPQETGKLPRSLSNLPVVVVYLYQEQTLGVGWRPGATMGPGGPYLPLRCGHLLHAFKDGEIAHFFFKLSSYVNPEHRRSSTRVKLNEEVKFQDRSSDPPQLSYAHLSQDLGFDLANSDDTLSFQGIVDTAYLPGEWRTLSFGSIPLDVTYDPVFYRVVGLFREQGRSLAQLTPIQRSVQSNVFAEYELVAGTMYYIKVVTHLYARRPTELPGEGRAKLKLVFDPEAITPVGPTALRITSLYELEYWSFIAKTPRIREDLRIVCEHEDLPSRRDHVRKELLCPEISLPTTISSPKTPTQFPARGRNSRKYNE